MGTLSAHVTDDLEKRAKERISALGKKMSPYISELVERDLARGSAGSFNPSSPNCLVEAAERHIPFFADEMREACKNLDQPKAFALLLMNFAGGKSGVSSKFIKAAEEAASYGK